MSQLTLSAINDVCTWRIGYISRRGPLGKVNPGCAKSMWRRCWLFFGCVSPDFSPDITSPLSANRAVATIAQFRENLPGSSTAVKTTDCRPRLFQPLQIFNFFSGFYRHKMVRPPLFLCILIVLIFRHNTSPFLRYQKDCHVSRRVNTSLGLDQPMLRISCAVQLEGPISMEEPTWLLHFLNREIGLD